MPSMDDPGKKAPEGRPFIREKIVRRPISKRLVVKRLLILLFVALLFGVVAAVSFVAALPFAERYLTDETTMESSTVSIPTDEPETAAPETEPPTASETQALETMESLVESAVVEYGGSLENLETMYGKFNSVVTEADKGIVTVHSVRHKVDWFDNPVEMAGQYAGAVIANTSQELLILTPVEAVESADSIKVTLGNGAVVDGFLKQRDRVTGMAVVSVDVTKLDEHDRSIIKTLVLGNSFSVKQGDMLAAIGSPIGVVHSQDYGFISYIRRNVPVTDGVSRVFYSGVRGNAESGTFLINIKGELIGWVTDEHTGEQTTGVTIIKGVSDYKGVLEKMTNGQSIPFMGIQGQMVNEELAGAGTPSGIYVTNSIADGPAYSTGIQNGDIITMIGESSITNLKDFQNQVESLKVGEMVKVTIQRNGRENFTELQYQVTIGAR